MVAATLQCVGSVESTVAATLQSVGSVEVTVAATLQCVGRVELTVAATLQCVGSVEVTAAATLKQHVGSVECSVRTEWRVRRQPQWGRVVQSSALREACARALQAEAAACRRSMGGSKDQTPLPRVPAALQLQLYMMAWPLTGKLANE